MDNIINDKQSRLSKSSRNKKPKAFTLEQCRKFYRFIHYVSLAGLGFISLALVFPVCTSSSQALVLDHQDPKPATLSLSLPSTSEIDITPQAGGQFGAVSSKLQIESSSNSGYQVYVSTMDQTNAMVGTKGEIKALVSPSSSTSFPTNTWGYALGTVQAGPETEYQGLPLTPTVVYNTDQATAGIVDTYYLSFGTNIDTSLPAGQYTNNVVISVIANPQKITNLSELTYMQDMTSSICSNTKGADGLATITPGNEVEKRLIDSRDGKEYWVSKLADQNCWMVQNLALDLNEKTLPLTPETSDVAASWEPQSYTETSVPKKGTSTTTANKTRSWDMGEYVLVTLNGEILCGDSTPATPESPDTDGANSVRYGYTLDICKSFQNVANWSDGYVAQAGVWQGVRYDYVAANADLKKYDAHYLIGNYYQWLTATAGSGNGLVSTGAEEDVTKLKNAESSICPKGWKLSAGGRNMTTRQPFDVTDSMYRLLLAYGYPQTGDYNASGIIGWSGGRHQSLVEPPMYFVLAGNTSVMSGAMRNMGSSFDEWTSTAEVTANRVYVVNMSSDNVSPSSPAGDEHGLSVRCLAR